jgi:hypothetical protein
MLAPAQHSRNRSVIPRSVLRASNKTSSHLPPSGVTPNSDACHCRNLAGAAKYCTRNCPASPTRSSRLRKCTLHGGKRPQPGLERHLSFGTGPSNGLPCGGGFVPRELLPTDLNGLWAEHLIHHEANVHLMPRKERPPAPSLARFVDTTRRSTCLPEN